MMSANVYAKPRIRLSSDKVNFGTIRQGQILTKEVDIKNEYNEAIKINGIYESCGCLFVREEQMEIAPNSSKSFTIKFDSTFFKGKQKKYIDVLTSEKRKNIHRISIRANIIQSFEISPPVLVVNQYQATGKEPIRIALKNKPSNKVEITGIDYDKSIFELRSQTKHQLEFRFKSGSLPKALKTNIRIKTNDEYLKEFPVPVRLKEEHIQYSSEFVDFGTVEEKFSRKELRLDFDRSVEIEDIILNSPVKMAFKYDLRKSRKNERRIRMYVKNTMKEKGNFKCDIDIKTKDKELGDIKIPCFGYFE